ncbi:glutathione-dependent disulfide-bond oxidoreductase [Streptococcus danieliae]|uniref:Glutathione-dependent disulfide-bond oxidoreductase n=1 Tax=Streptococcus danieliae TaxID=747656 RepID=A0A7Z0S5C4_9STRE|nr:glutathione-dependent disulfide-bond oxidoreductase [Streptococcus danieliae]MBF0699908.1 glutathione-dependent disulfide-bond oxidoreductase [Streptococcus danieliae]NYS97084.1 glutathione-dependent disulfide-bond oxidoreductase [Streptococcus danieliae]
MSQYKVPEIWENPANLGGAWGGLNQPTAGSRFEQTLPKGEKPFQLYSLSTPNGIKALIMFEELRELGIAEADYDAFRIKIGDGDQFGSDFVSINPNSKIPALLDLSGDKPVRVFESANILLYLAEKFDQFLPTDPADRNEVLNWLFWQTGAAPFLGGGFGHFFHYAPEKIEYAINRFAMEAKRQLDLLDKELATKPYIAGDSYSIADIAIWSWYGRLAQDKIWDKAGHFLNVGEYQNLQAWTAKIAQRPAVQRALEVNYQEI